MLLKKERIFFPNLNGLRFIAALLVIIHHTEQFKYLLGLQNSWDNKSIKLIGKLGVVMFFVLSGFLITYLLLKENEVFKTISIKQFYIRRILRIWPLYYFIIFLAFAVLNQIDFFAVPDLNNNVYSNINSKLLLFAMFLPNVALVAYSPIPFLSQSWSVGIEEQFYIIWPLLLKCFRNKYFILIGIIVLYLLGKLILYYTITKGYGNIYLDLFYKTYETFSINCMAIGSLMAYFLFTKSKVLKFLYSRPVQVISLLLLFILAGFGCVLKYINNELYSLLFSILIINLASNKNVIITLENKVFNFLVKISYGMYMFHSMVIVFTLKIFLRIGITNSFVLYFNIIALTILISFCSYRLFELRFIRLKSKFSRVESGVQRNTLSTVKNLGN